MLVVGGAPGLSVVAVLFDEVEGFRVFGVEGDVVIFKGLVWTIASIRTNPSLLKIRPRMVRQVSRLPERRAAVTFDFSLAHASTGVLELLVIEEETVSLGQGRVEVGSTRTKPSPL